MSKEEAIKILERLDQSIEIGGWFEEYIKINPLVYEALNSLSEAFTADGILMLY